jgi:hypothetical protein
VRARGQAADRAPSEGRRGERRWAPVRKCLSTPASVGAGRRRVLPMLWSMAERPTTPDTAPSARRRPGDRHRIAADAQRGVADRARLRSDRPGAAGSLAAPARAGPTGPSRQDSYGRSPAGAAQRTVRGLRRRHRRTRGDGDRARRDRVGPRAVGHRLLGMPGPAPARVRRVAPTPERLARRWRTRRRPTPPPNRRAGFPHQSPRRATAVLRCRLAPGRTRPCRPLGDGRPRAAADEQRAAAMVQVRLVEGERLGATARWRDATGASVVLVSHSRRGRGALG